MPGKKEQPKIEDLGNGKHRIRWQFKDAKGKWRYRQCDIPGSFKDADKALTRIKYELQQNTYIDKSRMTVKEQIEEWFDFHQYEIEEKTRARYEENIRLHIIPGIGNIQLSKFCVKDIQDFYKEKLSGGRMDGKEGGLATGTLRKIHIILKLAMDDAVTKERIRANPVKKIKPPRGTKPGEEIHPLNEEQAHIFLEKAKGDLYYNYFVSMLGTGCRPEEMLALERSDVDFRNKTITVRKVAVSVKGKMCPKSIPKTKKSRRTIKIGDAVVEALKNQLDVQDAWKQKLGTKLYKDKGLVFSTQTGGYINPSNINSRHFKPILKAAGLPNIRPYDMRHTHATLLYKLHKDIKLVSERLGHQDVAFTAKTYYHVLPGVEDEAVAMFDDVLTGKLLAPDPQPDKPAESACVNPCVTNNVIAFPTGALPKKKTRNCLRE
ncbi:MAG: site-specific integrase [Dehalococcoidia bacterium]|jgi:integrase